MPPILEFTSETAREKEWDNIAAIHAGIIQTTTWSFNQTVISGCSEGLLKFWPFKGKRKELSRLLST